MIGIRTRLSRRSGPRPQPASSSYRRPSRQARRPILLQHVQQSTRTCGLLSLTSASLTLGFLSFPTRQTRRLSAGCLQRLSGGLSQRRSRSSSGGRCLSLTTRSITGAGGSTGRWCPPATAGGCWWYSRDKRQTALQPEGHGGKRAGAGRAPGEHQELKQLLQEAGPSVAGAGAGVRTRAAAAAAAAAESESEWESAGEDSQ